jgi:NADP-dependent 3-hydroxy acid dehydrogenase YdfG
MPARTWLITGVSSGFGRELTMQLLERGERVVGTVRRPDSVADLVERYPRTFTAEQLDVTDPPAMYDVVNRGVAGLGVSTS